MCSNKKCTCVCVCMCICVYVCICVFLYVCMGVCAYVCNTHCVCVYVCICVHVRMCKCLCITVASPARTTLGVWAVAEEVTPTSSHQQAGVEKSDAKKGNKLAEEEKPLGIICSLKGSQTRLVKEFINLHPKSNICSSHAGHSFSSE